MTTLVIGANGLVGSRIAARLAGGGERVVAVGRGERRVDAPVEYAAITHPEGPAPWTPADVMTNGIVIGAILGAGGGAELDNAIVLDGLQKRFGARKGKMVYADLREEDDPEAPTTSSTRTPWLATPKRVAKGSLAMPDSGSVKRLPIIASQTGGGSGARTGAA